MVRLKQTFPETAQLMMVGPKSIIPHSQVVEAPLKLTWYEFLTGELQLPIDKNSGIFACTSRFCPSSPKDGEGWRCELHQKISDFVSKFERKRKQYTVRFCHPSDISTYQETHINGASNGNATPAAPRRQPDQQRRRTRAPTPGPAGHRSPATRNRSSTPTSATRRPNIVIPTQGAAPRTRPSTPSPAQAENYQKPRYYSANGLAHTSSANRNQQLHYGTRLKRRHEQTMAQGTTGGGAAGQRNGEASNAKQKRIDNGRRNNLPSVIQRHQLQQQQQQLQQQRQMITRGGTTSRKTVVKTELDAPSAVPRIESVRSISASAVKMELQQLDDDEVEEEEEEEEWSRNWDDYDEPQLQENGNRLSGRNRDDDDDDEVDLASDSDDDDDVADDASLCTAATQEENELRTEGISVEDVKSLVEGRITRFSNAYMLRVKNEIRKLRRNNLWDRNVNRSPLACYLLTELFKE